MLVALWIVAAGLGAVVTRIKAGKLMVAIAGITAIICGALLALFTRAGAWIWIWFPLTILVWTALWWWSKKIGPKWTITAWIIGIVGAVLLAAFGSGVLADFPKPWPLLLGGLGALTLLLEPSNDLCRAVLDVSKAVKTPNENNNGTLKGGRIIGPLERILLVVLGLADALGIVVALIAAKGIIRFPEISADNKGGNKAEEFLIGSFVSWGIALLMTFALRFIA